MTASVQLEKTKKGTEYWYIYLSYKDPITGEPRLKKKSTGLPAKNNKKKAKAMIPDMIRQYAYLEVAPDSKTSVLLCDYLRDWMARKKHEVKQSTYEGYEYRMARILEYFEPREYRLRDVTSGMLDKYFRWCLKQGKISQKDGSRSGLSVRSVRSYKSLLSAAFDQAIIDGIIAYNPALPVTVHGPSNKKMAAEELFLTKEETEDMLHFLSESETFSFLMPIAFMLVYYGLRRSELLGLTWQQVDFDKKLIRIRQTVVRVKSCEVSDLTKTPAGRRDLALFPLAEKCLREVLAKQEQDRIFFGKGYKNEANYVFAWEDGRPYDPNYITRSFKKAMTAYGRPTITPHKLRHTCASFLIAEGWDVKQTQYWLGHEDIKTTLDIYAHFDKKQLNSMQADMANIASGAEDLFTSEVTDTADL